MASSAVIETGGKQYLVSPNSKIQVEKLDSEQGANIVFDKVLLLDVDGNVKVGKPYLTGTKVTGQVVSQGRGDKLTVFKYRAKSRYRRKTGHRQYITEVQINSIG